MSKVVGIYDISDIDIVKRELLNEVPGRIVKEIYVTRRSDDIIRLLLDLGFVYSGSKRLNEAIILENAGEDFRCSEVEYYKRMNIVTQKRLSIDFTLKFKDESTCGIFKSK